MDNSQIEVFMALDQAYKSGNKLITDRVEAIVSPQKSKLPEVLQEVIDSIKDSPILEPELYATLQKDNGMLIGFTKGLSASIDLDNFDAITVCEFVSEARFKILNKTDKDGVFKTTPNIDLITLPKLSAISTLSEALANKMDQDAYTDLTISLAKVPEGIALSEWERGLIVEMFTAYVMASVQSLGGIAQDRTPFARYLKNV